MDKYTAMNLKNIPIKPKKIPYYLALFLLTIGASLILGFLSFSGMYALVPVLPLAFIAFGLSVAYEGEIYLQNIKGALNKLFKNNYLKNHLAKDYLLAHFPEKTDAEGCPEFFADYGRQLKLLHTFSHKTLNADSKKRKRKIEKTIRDMEKWFALQLFPTQNSKLKDQSEYAKQLRDWLALPKNKQQEWQDRLETRRITFYLVQAFSVCAGLFMGLGTTYLIVEAFSVIPLFAAIPFGFWPILILPMAAIAGAAYAFLTYNAITDLINNDTLRKWYYKLTNDLSKGLTFNNVFLALTAVFLAGLAIALTICTAGTWWTIATNARPLFEWMKNMPSFIMGIINPIITGLSALFFNFQNTAESLEMVDQAINAEENVFQKFTQYVSKGYQHLIATENWVQILNPFRLFLKLTVTPLRVLLFLGHLISIALTADRMPGVPQMVAALVAIISEGFEDAHYFIGHSHNHTHGHSDKDLVKEHLENGHGHNHDMDIPTVILKTIASPLYLLAAVWDYVFSQFNSKSSNEIKISTQDNEKKHPEVLTFTKAWNKQRDIPEESDVNIKENAQHPSENWQAEHADTLIEKYKTEHFNGVFIGSTLAEQKKSELEKLQISIRSSVKNNGLKDALKKAQTNPIFNKHRLFAQNGDQTSTQMFIENLPERVGIALER